MSLYDTLETAQSEKWFESVKVENNHKVGFFGDSGTGKTTYLKRISKGKFVETSPTPLLFEKKVDVIDKLQLNVLDFSGQLLERATRPVEYFKDVSVALIFFEVGNEQSFRNAVFVWFKLVKSSIQHIIFIVTKNDNDNFHDLNFTRICGVEYPTFCISSKTGKNVELPIFKIHELINRK